MLALALIGASGASAQRAATVPASSDIYDRIESVAARFPASGVHLGLRPLSRRAIERIVGRLGSSIDAARDTAGAGWARAQLEYVERSVGDSALRATALRSSWRVSETASNAPNERFTGNGLGFLDAETQPFAARRGGEPTGRGTVAEIVPVGVLDIGGRVAFGVEPHVGLFALRGDDASLSGVGSRWYARGVLGNVAIEVGADDRLWGQSPIGAQSISGNAPPLPAIELSSDTAFTLPSVLRHVGPLRATILLADLGAAQVPRHDRLAGWQVSMQPWTRMELNVNALVQTGGSGAPPATFLRRVADVLILPDALSPSHSDLQISNKLAGGSLLLRFPELAATELYYELQFDDFDARRMKSTLTQDAAHTIGVRVPVELRDGELALRGEWHRTGIRMYEHTQFPSGVTYRERLIGDPLGPNAGGGYVSVAWQRSPHRAWSLAFADERRDPSQYVVTSSDSLDNGFRFVRVTNDPDIRRWRVMASTTQSLGQGAAGLSVGYNRAWRTGQPGANQWMVAVTISGAATRSF